MNKTAIKNFAIWARNKLIADISYRAGLMGITADGIRAALPQSTGQTEFYDIGTAEPYVIMGEAICQRRQLAELIQRKEKDTDYKTAYKYIIEEVAYTWFNRLIAVRFMEVNDYLPNHIRVLSSDTGKLEPDLVTTPFDAELAFTNAEQQAIIDLKNANKLDEVFRMLFIKQCNALNESLPALFEKTNDYTELLMNLSVIDQDGVVYHLVHDIPEEDFDVNRGGQVEIIGWLYQYYISEKHDEVIDPIHGKVVKKEEVPAATQLFTTDWVVRYLIDNSVGRYWIERNPNSKLSEKLPYFVKSKTGEIRYVNERIMPQELSTFDPCVGSGHFLVYAFDVLMHIYREYGYSEREAAAEIVQHNLYGIDIDGRAVQLAYFAVMMKARQYDRRFFYRGIQPHIYEILESNTVDRASVEYFFGSDTALKVDVEALLSTLKDAKEYGSILQIPSVDFGKINERFAQLDVEINIYNNYLLGEFQMMIRATEIMNGKYAVVATNPPYLNKYDDKLRAYIFDRFNDYKGDLFSVFMYRNFSYCKVNGFCAFMTPNVWMFIASYVKLRQYIINHKAISTLVQCAKGAFFKEATVDVCAFVLGNEHKSDRGIYFRLEKFKGDMDTQNRAFLDAVRSIAHCVYAFSIDSAIFEQIPGTPIAYWVSAKMLDAFRTGCSFEGNTKKGVLTGDNARFTRFWHEIDISKIGFGLNSHDAMIASKRKWFPVTSGGLKRKWYGNFDTVVNLENDGKEIKETVRNYRLRDPQYYMLEAVTWTEVSSGLFACRYVPQGILFGNGGPVSFFPNGALKYHLGLLNSNTTMSVMEYLAPTVNYGPEQISKIPLIKARQKEVETLVDACISISVVDWNSFETSWDFQSHPLAATAYEHKEHLNVGMNSQDHEETVTLLSERYKRWEQECEYRFSKLKKKEEELNNIFIDIYGLRKELTPDVDEKDVTVRKADLQRDIQSLLSYAVGCMFGRYSIGCQGLIYAGGRWDETKYSSFLPDFDNVIPITDEEYLEDDIVSRLCTWLKIVYGEASLEDNLDFIAKALSNKGSSSREIIRNYFLNDFFKEHEKVYQKRPIYWLFDSGRQNGFKALIYLHRYNADTIGNLRVDYLHRMQRVYESEMGRMQDIIEHSANAREVGQATKRKDKLTKQLKECREYDEKLAHLALSRIELDLDDGVKVNYRKLQTANDGKFYEVLSDSKNIMSKK